MGVIRTEVGRKIAQAITKKSPEVVERLRQALATGANIEMACRYAGINKTTYYSWCKEDEKFSNEMAQMRDQPIFKALKTVVSSLNDPSYAFKYLEKKVPDEWGNKATIKHDVDFNNKEISPEMVSVIEKFNEQVKQILTSKKEE